MKKLLVAVFALLVLLPSTAGAEDKDHKAKELENIRAYLHGQGTLAELIEALKEIRDRLASLEERVDALEDAISQPPIVVYIVQPPPPTRTTVYVPTPRPTVPVTTQPPYDPAVRRAELASQFNYKACWSARGRQECTPSTSEFKSTAEACASKHAEAGITLPGADPSKCMGIARAKHYDD